MDQQLKLEEQKEKTETIEEGERRDQTSERLNEGDQLRIQIEQCVGIDG